MILHHVIWRGFNFSIRKCSTELHDEKDLRGHYPSALSPEVHDEWGLNKILEYMGPYEVTTRKQTEQTPKSKKISKNTV